MNINTLQYISHYHIILLCHDFHVLALHPELYAAAHLEYAQHVLEVAVAWHAAHEHRAGHLLAAERVAEIVPPAELLHYLLEGLVLEHELAVGPAGHHVGVNRAYRGRAHALVILGLLAGPQSQLSALAAYRAQGYAAAYERGHHLAGGIGVDVKLRAKHPDLLPLGLHREGMCRVVSHLEVDLARGLHPALLAVEHGWIFYPRPGVEPHLGAVGHGERVFASARRLQHHGALVAVAQGVAHGQLVFARVAAKAYHAAVAQPQHGLGGAGLDAYLARPLGVGHGLALPPRHALVVFPAAKSHENHGEDDGRGRHEPAQPHQSRAACLRRGRGLGLTGCQPTAHGLEGAIRIDGLARRHVFCHGLERAKVTEQATVAVAGLNP